MVFGYFSKEAKFKRTVAKATNKLAQSADRVFALEKLRDDGSEEAIFVLCKRFSFKSLKMIDDEQEKEWVVSTLRDLGEACLPGLLKYMKTATGVAYPLRALEDVTSKEKALNIIDQLLEEEEPGYTKNPEKRIQIIHWLSEWQEIDESEANSRITPYIGDFDENTRFAVVEALSLRPSAEAAEPLVNALLREEEESRRLRVRIAEVLSENKMDLCGRKSDVSKLFSDLLKDFRLQKNKLVKKKK